MPLSRYYRIALLAPLVLPALAWGVLHAATWADAAGLTLTLPEWAGFAVLILAISGLVYGLPYAAIVATIWKASRRWQRARLERLLLWLPLALTAVAAALVSGYNLIGQVDPDWPSYTGQTVLLGLGVGYGQALLIGLGAWVGRRTGCLVA